MKANLHLDRTVNDIACFDHVRLMTLSMRRRQKRGEIVRRRFRAERLVAYLRDGAGELARAISPDGKVLSSIFLLKATRGEYYQSAGTSTEGMSLGASHFLVYQLATNLRDEGKRRFSLGGAEPANLGLQQFKAGFGAEKLELESCHFFLGGALQKYLINTASLFRDLTSPHSISFPQFR